MAAFFDDVYHVTVDDMGNVRVDDGESLSYSSLLY